MNIQNNPIYINMKKYIEEDTAKIPYSRFNMVSYAIGKYGNLTEEAYKCIMQLFKDDLIVEQEQLCKVTE